jgi:hypothetical protein
MPAPAVFGPVSEIAYPILIDFGVSLYAAMALATPSVPRMQQRTRLAMGVLS